MRRIEVALQEDGIEFQHHGCCMAHPFPWQLEVQEHCTFSMLGPVWADDLAVMVDDESPQAVLQKTQAIAGAIFDHFALAGMDVNLGTSKTEIVLSLRGTGAPTLRKELFRHATPMLEVHTIRLGTLHVRLVKKYKHLGTVFSQGGKMVPEIRQRVGQAQAEFRRHRKKIYNQQALAPERRIQLFRAFIMSGLQYNIAIWPPLDKQEFTHFSNGLMSLYTSLAFAIWGERTFQWRDEKVLTSLSMPSPMELLRTARLRYLQHIAVKGDGHVWTILHSEEQWLRMVDADLQWLREQVPWRVPQVDPRDDWDPWKQVMLDGAKWKNLVQKAGLHAELQRRKESDWYDWHRELLEMLATESLWSKVATTETIGYHACLKCRMRFNTKAAWSVHAFKIHNRVTKVRKVADGLECRVCLRRYYSHDRLINHLKYSTKCYKEHRRRMLFTDTQPAANSALVKKTNAEGAIPVLPVHGPQPQQEPAPGYQFFEDLDKDEEETVEDLITLFEEFGPSETTVEDAILAVHHAFYRSCVYAPRLINVFCLTLDDYLAKGMAQDDVAAERLRALRAAVYEKWSGPWLLSGLPNTAERAKTGVGLLEPDKEFATLQKQRQAPRVQRPLRLRQYIFLHLFSGHRRSGDLQQAVEKVGIAAGRDTAAISVDIVISERFGNLLDEGIFALFYRAIMAGWISGIAAGPPCETWSKARERYYADQRGPRPLRDRYHLVGYSVLKLKEVRQVMVGNQLLGVAVRLFLAAWLYGVYFALEHPEEPEQPSSASIWHLPCLVWMMGLPGVERHLFLQGLFGAPSAKPTHLLFAHPPRNTKQIFEGCQTTRRVPKATSIGKGEDGQYLTSRLKVYPEKFCQAIALSWWNHAQERPVDTVQNDAQHVQYEAFQDAIRSMHRGLDESGDGNGAFGPDYHPVAAQCRRN